MRLKITLLSFFFIACFQQMYAQNCGNADFETVNGLAVLELDSKTAGSWDRRTLPGASGGQALFYNGPNAFNNPPGPSNSVINYTLRVNSAGTYRVIVRSRIQIISSGPEPATSEHNDMWMRINGDQYFAQRGSSRLFPRGGGSPNPAGASGNGYFKIYTNQLGWNYNTFTNDGPGHNIFVTFNSPGTYNIQIGGRSNGYSMDKIALYQESRVSASQAQNGASTACDGSTPTPPPANNSAPTVSITNPDNGDQFSEGDSFAVQLSSSDPDGNIASHEIKVNGTVVDTDGATYSPYQFTNMPAGDYEIIATVTDSNGLEDSSAVDITVVGDDTAPPPPPTANQAPSVTITSPTDGDELPVGGVFTVQLSTNDTDGNIVRHEIFVNGRLVDTDGASYSPYTSTSNPEGGDFSILAVVTDDDGATGSSTISIGIDKEGVDDVEEEEEEEMMEEEEEEEEEEMMEEEGNVAPSVTLNLQDGGTAEVGSTVSVGLTANDTDGTIVQHQIFVNGALVDTDGANFTPHLITNIQPGTYDIMATVTDNDGATGSASVTISVDEDSTTTPPVSDENQAPTVAFANLVDGQDFELASTISVDVDADDSDGTVEKYEIFVNGLLVDTDGAFFTPHPITNAAEGSFEIKVTVTDNEGATASETITVTVGGNPDADISFNLLGGSLDINIGVLSDGATISASKTGDVNIQANVPMSAESVKFNLSGQQTKSHIENVIPYTLFGDFEGDIFSGSLASGFYTLEVIAYSEDLAVGDVVATRTINFTVGSTADDKSLLFPNPVKTDGKVSVRLPEGASGQFTYSITNSVGVQVDQGTFSAVSSERDVQLSLPNIGRQVQGVYYMTLSSNVSREIIPLIRE